MMGTMRSRADEVRKRIAKRKRERERKTKNFYLDRKIVLADDEERYGTEQFVTYEGEPEKGGHPLFKTESLIFKILLSSCLVLFIAILFRQEGENFDSIKQLVSKSLNQDFQFVTVANWYEKQFGKPLALFPISSDKKKNDTNLIEDYALPAAGRVAEEFSKNGQNITIETEKGADVVAMNEGLVEFAGVKEGFGKTIIVQHSDNSETWYGNLDNIDVYLYQYVKKGEKLGQATDSDDGTKGEFYFAIRKGDDFIDPIQVIKFE